MTAERIEELTQTLEKLQEDARELEEELDTWTLDEDDFTDEYDQWLDDNGVSVLEQYSASYILKNIDETAYNIGLSEYVNSLDKTDDPSFRDKAEELSEIEADIMELEEELEALQNDDDDEETEE